MSKVLVTESYLENIAAAIRAKNNSSDRYTPPQMAQAILDIPTGTPNLQSKTVTENGTVTPDAGYDGLSSVEVNVTGGDVICAENAYATSGSFSYSKQIEIPNAGAYNVVVQMFVNSTHTVKVNGTAINITSQYPSCYAYLWNFTQTFAAGDVIDIAAISTGAPMVTVIVQKAAL